jgi:formate hydrogenlyase subunit 3/multisubunit Na+/H+ antiporter MnhD subunit
MITGTATWGSVTSPIGIGGNIDMEGGIMAMTAASVGATAMVTAIERVHLV